MRFRYDTTDRVIITLYSHNHLIVFNLTLLVCIYHDGTEYQFGETFSAWHGCSQCVCNDGIIICDDSLCVEGKT